MGALQRRSGAKPSQNVEKSLNANAFDIGVDAGASCVKKVAAGTQWLMKKVVNRVVRRKLAWFDLAFSVTMGAASGLGCDEYLGQVLEKNRRNGGVPIYLDCDFQVGF